MYENLLKLPEYNLMTRLLKHNIMSIYKTEKHKCLLVCQCTRSINRTVVLKIISMSYIYYKNYRPKNSRNITREKTYTWLMLRVQWVFNN